MSNPAVYNWPDIFIGTTYGPIDFTLRGSDGKPLDITGWKAFCQVRKPVSGDLVLDLSPTIFGDATNGIFRISVADEFTSILTAQVAECDLIVEDSLGTILTPLVTGKISILPIISKTTQPI